jgi:hypothetical protein
MNLKDKYKDYTRRPGLKGWVFHLWLVLLSTLKKEEHDR